MAGPKSPGVKYEGGGHGIFKAMSFIWTPSFDEELLPGIDFEVLADQLPKKPLLTGTTSK